MVRLLFYIESIFPDRLNSHKNKKTVDDDILLLFINVILI